MKAKNVKESLQRIEDFYMARGYEGNALRKALAKDKEYQKRVKKRGGKLTKQFKITAAEKKKYLLSMDDDWKILRMCKELEKLKLTKQDETFVKFIKSQLEHEWRVELLKKLKQLLKKYLS